MKLPMRNVFCVVSCCAAALAGFAGESLTAASPGGACKLVFSLR